MIRLRCGAALALLPFALGYFVAYGALWSAGRWLNRRHATGPEGETSRFSDCAPRPRGS